MSEGSGRYGVPVKKIKPQCSYLTAGTSIHIKSRPVILQVQNFISIRRQITSLEPTIHMAGESRDISGRVL